MMNRLFYLCGVLAGEADADKQRLLQQLMLLDAHYHGGLEAYINNAKQLLADSKEGECAFEICHQLL
jgi:UDP-sugar pyrophosphorylase